jgi:hypothetical protein
MNKLDRIMEVVERAYFNEGNPDYECAINGTILDKFRSDIAAILAAPDTIEVEGVEWKRTKQVWETKSINGAVGGVQEINGKFEFWVMDWKDYPRREDMENGCDLATALAAATAAIKGKKR